MIYFERLRLRAIEPADLPLFVAWLNDPEVRLGLNLYLPISQVSEERWFEGILGRAVEEQPFAMEVQDEGAWRLIGNCSFFNIDWRSRHAEVGIIIGDKRRWNHGYGTEAMRFLQQHGFATLNLHRVFLRVYAHNPRAVRAYEKAGFVHEGRLRQARYHEGAYYDELLMSVLRPEWEARQASDA